MGNNNIWKIHHAAQNWAAWEDWRFIEQKLHQAGRDDLAKLFYPAEDSGWREVDRQIGLVRKRMHWPPVYEMRQEEGQDAPNS